MVYSAKKNKSNSDVIGYLFYSSIHQKYMIDGHSNGVFAKFIIDESTIKLI
jgi:hypothetical protein